MNKQRMQRAGPALPPVFRALLVALALTAFAAAPALAQTVIEKRLAAIEPCASFKFEQAKLGLPVTMGLDKLKGLSLSRAEIALAGDEVTLSFVGGLACRTSDRAPLKGDASVDLTASAQVSLADCRVRSLAITPTRFGGTFGELVRSAWSPLIGPKLQTRARAMITDACADFVTGNTKVH